MAADLETERALLRLPNVAACAVLLKHAAAGEQRIAYVVPAGVFAQKTVESRLAESAPEVRCPDAYVLVSKLPLTAAGDLDEAALHRLPVADQAVAQAIERELLADPRIERAAVFVEELPRRRTAFHVSDLVSTDTAEVTAKAGATVESGAEGREPSTGLRSSHVRPPDTKLPIAALHGPPLERAAGGPETLPDALRIAAERVKDRGITYLSNDGTTREQSLPALLAEARRICRGLQERGLSPGQHVLLQLADAEDVLPAFWGCLLGGFVPAITPIPPSYEAGTNELERLCQVWQLLDGPPLILRERLKPAIAPLQVRLSIEPTKLLILDDLRTQPDACEAPALNADDTAFLVFTSGSTGAPKIIMLSHRNILTRSQGTNQLCRHETSDRILNWLPFDHIGSISDWHLRCIDLGCHMVYCSKEYVLGDPLNWLRLIDRFRITHSWAPNFAYALVNEALNRTNETFELSSMKALLTAGEAVSSNTVHDFLRRLASHGLSSTALRPAFGMAELGSGVTYYLPTAENPVRVQHVDRTQLEGALYPVDPADPRAIGFTSLGPVIPGAGMRIVDDDKNPVPELTIGRLHISGGPVCRGYFRNDEANREVFVGDGWFNTGDRGFIAGGELYLTGRDKESLIVNGANYSNSEIESVVEEVPSVQVSFVAACAVRPVGDPEERLAIFFSPSPSAKPMLAELLRKVQNSITRKTGVKPDYLLPVERDVIPKTAIGKIQRKQLVKRFESGEFAALLKEVDVLLENERTTPDWFLVPGWRARAVRKPAPPSARSFLLLSDRHGLAEEIKQQLERRRIGTATVWPGEPPSGALPANLEFTDIIHTKGFAPAEPVRSAPAENGGHATAAGVATSAAGYVLELLQSLSRNLREGNGSGNSTDRQRIWVVASHSQAVAATDTVDAARVMVPAALMAFAQDVPTVECRHLDLPFAGDPAEVAGRAALVVSELEALAPQSELAFRDGIRLAPSFARVTFPPPAERASALQKGAFYLLTGGLGGVGSELARHLLTVWHAKLLIVGRTPIEPEARDASAGEGDGVRRKRELLAELQALGTVRYRAHDIRDAAQIERGVAELEVELNQPLAGVFHLASVYRELPATEESITSFAQAVAPKVDGAIALHQLLARRPEAFVVCFSSVVSFFSAAGNAAYAAANRFVDAYCHQQRNKNGRKSYSIDWSVWDGIATEGAAQEILAQLGKDAGDSAVSAAEISARLAEAGKARGYLRIPVAQGMRSLSAALGLPPGQLLVGVDVANPNLENETLGETQALLGIRGAFACRSATDECDPREFVLASARDRFGQKVALELRQLPALPLADDGQVDRDAVLAELRGATRTIVLPQTPLEQQLAEIWKAVLGLETLGTTESFFDLGGTSLLSVRLFAEIERRIGVSLQLATLFQAATIQALAQLLEAKVGSQAVSSLAMLAEATGDPTLFLLHDIDGEIELYRPLAALLAPEIRVYGLAPYGKDRFTALHTRIEEMVGYHVEKIREVKPSGPYLLGGSGTGGALAFEVACRLQALGQEVKLVALFDAPDQALRIGLFRAFQRGLAPILGGRARPGAGLLATAKRLAKDGFDQARVRLLDSYVSRGATPPWFLEFIPARVVYDYASSGHRPSQFRGRLTLYRATSGTQDDTPARERFGDEHVGWDPRSTGGVELVDVTGGHRSMLEAPHVTDLAKRLAKRIREAHYVEPDAGPRTLKNPQPISAA